MLFVLFWYQMIYSPFQSGAPTLALTFSVCKFVCLFYKILKTTFVGPRSCASLLPLMFAHVRSCSAPLMLCSAHVRSCSAPLMLCSAHVRSLCSAHVLITLVPRPNHEFRAFFKVQIINFSSISFLGSLGTQPVPTRVPGVQSIFRGDSLSSSHSVSHCIILIYQ